MIMRSSGDPGMNLAATASVGENWAALRRQLLDDNDLDARRRRNIHGARHVFDAVADGRALNCEFSANVVVLNIDNDQGPTW